MPMDPFYRIRFDDGTHFDYCGDKEDDARRDRAASARRRRRPTSASCRAPETIYQARLRAARRHAVRQRRATC
ncbi:MAG: hypothetical protein MZV49_22640 [Rhodopseudomonas palustris]|nr:hypothetical protein [Rhodopseudomonas palustris]